MTHLPINARIIKLNLYSSLAQSVEHAAVNRRVVGSSPTGGAKPGCYKASRIVGVDGGGGTPVPIPNTAVKPTCVEDTWLEAARENRQMPTSQAPEVVLLPGLVSYVEKAARLHRGSHTEKEAYSFLKLYASFSF